MDSDGGLAPGADDEGVGVVEIDLHGEECGQNIFELGGIAKFHSQDIALGVGVIIGGEQLMARSGSSTIIRSMAVSEASMVVMAMMCTLCAVSRATKSKSRPTRLSMNTENCLTGSVATGVAVSAMGMSRNVEVGGAGVN